MADGGGPAAACANRCGGHGQELPDTVGASVPPGPEGDETLDQEQAEGNVEPAAVEIEREGDSVAAVEGDALAIRCAGEEHQGSSGVGTPIRPALVVKESPSKGGMSISLCPGSGLLPDSGMLVGEPGRIEAESWQMQQLPAIPGAVVA